MAKFRSPTIAQVQVFVDCLRQHANGKDNAKRGAKLALLLGFKRHADRQLRALKQAAINANILVCSGNDGYWLPRSRAEADETIGRVKSQAFAMMHEARAIEKLCDKQFGKPETVSAGPTPQAQRLFEL